LFTVIKDWAVLIIVGSQNIIRLIHVTAVPILFRHPVARIEDVGQRENPAPAVKHFHMVFHEHAIQAHVLFMPIRKLFTTRDRLKDIVLVHFGQCMTHAMKTLHPDIGLWGLIHVGAGGGNI